MNNRKILLSNIKLNSIWIRRVLQHDDLFCNLMEGRMVGNPTRGRRRLHMLEDLYENSGYEVLKRTAEEKVQERKYWYQKSAGQQTTEDEKEQH